MCTTLGFRRLDWVGPVYGMEMERYKPCSMKGKASVWRPGPVLC
jgi:hypothetical protein